MRYRWLGKSGLSISEVGFGAWAIGGAWWGPQDDTDSRLALHQALDMGCNFIDTAWVYGNGHSEKLIAGVMRERGERPVLASKVPPKNWNWDNPPGTPLSEAYPADWVVAKTEESLRNLGVERLDVQQMHTWSAGWNSQADPLLSAMDRLKREGKIRAFGISLRDKGAAEANDLVRLGHIDTLQVFFNLLYQEPLWELFPLASRHKVGIIARVPLAFGALSGRFNAATKFAGDDHRQRLYRGQDLSDTLRKVAKLSFLRDVGRSEARLSLAEAALRWTLAFPEVSVTIPGIRNQRQAILNCRAGSGQGLPASCVQKAKKLYRSNFGLPVRSVASTEGVAAVLMSGVKVVAPRKTRKKTRPRKGRGSSRKGSKTPRSKGRKK